MITDGSPRTEVIGESIIDTGLYNLGGLSLRELMDPEITRECARIALTLVEQDVGVLQNQANSGSRCDTGAGMPAELPYTGRGFSELS